jgi:hypothetical protein
MDASIEAMADAACLAMDLAIFSPPIGERLAKGEIAPDRLALENGPKVRQ